MQASEELPINLPSADGDVNSHGGDDAVNEQHVARSAARIDSSHKSTSYVKTTMASAMSSEPNPTASFTKDTFIPTEVSTYPVLVLISRKGSKRSNKKCLTVPKVFF